MMKYLYKRALDERQSMGLYASSTDKTGSIKLITEIQEEIGSEIDFLVYLKLVFEKFPKYQIENTHYGFHIKPKKTAFKEGSVLREILWNWCNNGISEFNILNLENIDDYINELKSYLECSPEEIVDEYQREHNL